MTTFRMLKILPTLDSYGGPKLQKAELALYHQQLAPARRGGPAILERVLIGSVLGVTNRGVV